MNNFDEYLKLRSTVEPPVDTDDTVMFDIVNRTIMPNHITDIIVKDDNLSRNIKYRIQRYFEGVDLSTKSISFRYNTPDSETDESFAKNIIIEENLITFEWQVSNKVTYKSGIVEYDIIFYDNGGYCWHTKPATIKVETGLKYHTLTPKPSYDWLDSWRAEAGNILVQCREAESKAIQVEGNISVAIDAATRATDAVGFVTLAADTAVSAKNIATQKAISATSDANRAKAEADRAESIVGGDYAGKKEINSFIGTAEYNNEFYNLTIANMPSKLPEIFTVTFTLPQDYAAGDKIRIEGVPHLVNLYGKGPNSSNLTIDSKCAVYTNGFFKLQASNGGIWGTIRSSQSADKIIKTDNIYTTIVQTQEANNGNTTNFVYVPGQSANTHAFLQADMRLSPYTIYKKKLTSKNPMPPEAQLIRYVVYSVPAVNPSVAYAVLRAMLLEGDYTTADLPADYWEDTYGEYSLTSYAGNLTSGLLKKGQTVAATINTACSTAYVSGEELLESQIADLRAYVGYTEKDIVGLEADFKNNRFIRLAGAANKSSGDDFDFMNAFGGRRRCILTDDGTVLAYYGESGYIETGKTTQAFTVSDTVYPIGTNVQVMVEQPKFYYKVVPLDVEPITDGKGFHLRKARYYVSDTMKTGFKLHPAFISNGSEKNFIYLSAFEGCLWDASASTYITTDAQVADFAADMLSSIAGAKPISGSSQALTRGNARKLAQKRGAGWQQETGQAACATELLFMVEYASFNMQENLGAGAVNKPWVEDAINYAENTGATSNLGNVTGAVTNVNGINIVTYRGEENFYGNIWKFIDGFNINAKGVHEVYVADSGFIDGKITDNYKNAGITLAKTSGYVSAFGYNEPYDWLFFASETLGNTSLPVGDYFSQNNTYNSIMIALLGGSWPYGVNAGGFHWSMVYILGNRERAIGGRLVYIPNQGEQT